MSHRVQVTLKSPAHEMAQEEILKQVAFLSKDLARPAFLAEGAVLEFDAPEGQAADLAARAGALAANVQRGLRSLQRKVVYRSPAMDSMRFAMADSASVEGIHQVGPGQVILEGIPLRLFLYFDRVFEEFGAPWEARPTRTPTLIPSQVLARCDYFRSFPNNVTFACHLLEEPERVGDFRERHRERETLDGRALGDMATPEACLSPAVCYHVYHLNKGRRIPASGLVYGVCGKCFRYESSSMVGLRRLWDFTMREVVFMGSREYVLECRERSIEMMGRFLEDHRIMGEIRTASDPFFIAPDAVAKTYFQLSSETKYEIALALSDTDRIAVGSHNYHTDFFGRAFDVEVEGAGYMHSVCVAFGLERWVHAFLIQHGDDPSAWPDPVREAPEFRDIFAGAAL